MCSNNSNKCICGHTQRITTGFCFCSWAESTTHPLKNLTLDFETGDKDWPWAVCVSQSRLSSALPLCVSRPAKWVCTTCWDVCKWTPLAAQHQHYKLLLLKDSGFKSLFRYHQIRFSIRKTNLGQFSQIIWMRVCSLTEQHFRSIMRKYLSDY